MIRKILKTVAPEIIKVSPVANKVFRIFNIFSLIKSALINIVIELVIWYAAWYGSAFFHENSIYKMCKDDHKASFMQREIECNVIGNYSE